MKKMDYEAEDSPKEKHWKEVVDASLSKPHETVGLDDYTRWWRQKLLDEAVWFFYTAGASMTGHNDGIQVYWQCNFWIYQPGRYKKPGGIWVDCRDHTSLWAVMNRASDYDLYLERQMSGDMK